MLFDLCNVVFFTFLDLEEIGRHDNFLVVYFKKSVKLIILKSLILFLVHYILCLIRFHTLSFIIIFYAFEMYHFDFFKFKS